MDNQIEITINLLNEIYSKSNRHLFSLKNTSFKNIENILGVLILERLVGNINAIKNLLTASLESPNLEPAIGLILRNNLSLCKIAFKHSELQDNNSNLIEFYKSIFGENIQRTLQYISKDNSSDDIKSSLDNIKKNYGFILKETGIDLDKITEEKINYTINLDKRFNTLEVLYIAYSKYEHFGLNTLILQANSNNKEKIDRIKIAIHYSLQGIIVCLGMLQILDDELIVLNSQIANKKSIV